MKMGGILAGLVVVALIAWFAFGGEDAEPTAQSTSEAETGTSESGGGETQAESETMEEKADEAVTTIEERANDVKEAAEEKVNEAVENAAEKANEVMEEAADKVNDALGTATEDASMSTDTEPGGLLSVDGFNPTALRVMVANSDLNAIKKQAAEILIEQAEKNPERIQDTVRQLQEFLAPN